MTHIAIIGAGIIGAAAADRLTRAGAQVTLIDAQAPGTGTSATSLAWLNSNRKQPRTYHEFSVRGMHEWQQLAATFPQPNWYTATGNLTWATGEHRNELAQRITRLRDWDYTATEISTAHAAELEPHLQVPPDAIIAYFPSEGFIHTIHAIHDLTSRAQETGARLVITGEPVTIDTNSSRVTAIKLPDGDSVRADAYLCCAGWRTPHLLELLGLTVPMIRGDAPGSKAPCLVSRITTPEPLIRRVIHAPGLNLRPTLPGGLHLEASDINALVDVNTGQPDLDRHGTSLTARAVRLIPRLALPDTTETRLCIRPLPADGQPIAGWLPQLPNLYLLVTHSGVTLAPLLTRLATTELLHDTSEEDLAPYRPSRCNQHA